MKKYSEHLTKHLRLRQRIVFKIKHSKTISSLGKWDFDGTTAYEFDGKGSGAMLLTLADYDFTYEIKDNQLYIDFVNESAHDATYEFSVKGDTLILIGGEGTIGGTYELTKVHDKKADK